MKNSDGANMLTLRECGYAFLTFEEDQKKLFQILEEIGLVWVENEEEKED